MNIQNYTTNILNTHIAINHEVNSDNILGIDFLHSTSIINCFYHFNYVMKNCPTCSNPLQFKEMTGIIYGFIPSCNKNTYECANCKKTVTGLNWFLISFYSILGTVLLFETLFLGFKLLPLPVNLLNLMIGIGSYIIIIKGFRSRSNNLQINGGVKD